VADIGKLKGHAERFRVRLRYDSQAEAAAAKSSAVIRDIGPNWFLEIDVPARNRPNRQAMPPLEVRVDW
jgi:hypothetical protein